jgi:hypothetical protein
MARSLAYIFTILAVTMSFWDATGHLSVLFFGPRWLELGHGPDWKFWIHGITTFKTNMWAQWFWVCFHVLVAIFCVTATSAALATKRGNTQ